MLAYRSWLSLTSLRLPKSASASSKKSRHAAGLGRVEDLPQVLLGLPDVLADHGGQVDAAQVEGELLGHDLRCQGLAGAAGPGEECGDPEAAGPRRGEPPPLVDGGPLSGLRRHRSQLAVLELGQDQVLPPGLGDGDSGQVGESRPVPAASHRPHRFPAVTVRAELAGLPQHGADLGEVQVELGGHLVDGLEVEAQGALSLPPGLALLVGRGLLDVEGQRGPIAGLAPAAPSDGHEGGEPLDEPAQAPAGVRIVVLRAADEERGAGQGTFARQQDVEVVLAEGVGGDRVAFHLDQPYAQPVADGGEEPLLGLHVRADQLQHGRRSSKRSAGPGPHGRCDQELVGRRQGVGTGRDRLGQPAEPLVPVADPGELVQRPLVDPEGARGQWLAGHQVELHEPPGAQRSTRRHRRPVRAVECGQRRPERGVRA